MLIRILRYLIILNLLFLLVMPAVKLNKLYGIMPDSDWMVINTLHFKIYYSGDMTDLALYCSKIAEESYVYLANYLKHELSGTVEIILNSTESAFIHQNKKSYSLNSEYKDTHPCAVVNKIIISFDGSYASFHSELTHDLAHLFQYDIIYSTMPGRDMYRSGFYFHDYLIEYMADYLSTGYDERSDAAIRKIAGSDKGGILDVRSLNRARSGMSRTLGLSFFFFMESVFGKDIISELLPNIRDFDNIYKAIGFTTGLSIIDLNAAWKDFYIKRDTAVIEENKIDYPSFIEENKAVSVIYKGDGKIALLDHASGKIKKEIRFPFRNIKDASLSADGKYLVFIGVSFSSADIYLYDITGKNISRITNDLFTKKFPKISADNNSIVFLSNENEPKNLESNIYKLLNIDLKTNTKSVLIDSIKYGDKEIEYPASYFDQKDLALNEYSDDRDMNLSFLGSGAYWNNGFAGSALIAECDFLNEYKFSAGADFLKYGNGWNNAANLNLDYEYLKYAADFGAGFFYRSNPLCTIYPDCTGPFISQYPADINSTFYGAYAFGVFPFTRELLLKLKGSVSLYDNISGNSLNNIQARGLSLSLGYDSLVYRFAQPYSGTRCMLLVARDFDLSGSDISADIITFNFLQIFRFDKIIFSVKGGAGKISGKDGDYFKFHLGGFNTMEGHGLFAYSGSNAFLMDAELKFILLDKFILHWPVLLRFNDISLVFFADSGSAWDADFALFNPETHEFKDLKSSMGTGFRFSIYDHVAFQIDAAWPYYYKSFGKTEFVSGFELQY